MYAYPSRPMEWPGGSSHGSRGLAPLPLASSSAVTRTALRRNASFAQTTQTRSSLASSIGSTASPALRRWRHRSRSRCGRHWCAPVRSACWTCSYLRHCSGGGTGRQYPLTARHPPRASKMDARASTCAEGWAGLFPLLASGGNNALLFEPVPRPLA